jgi:hypothetical protein
LNTPKGRFRSRTPPDTHLGNRLPPPKSGFEHPKRSLPQPKPDFEHPKGPLPQPKELFRELKFQLPRRKPDFWVLKTAFRSRYPFKMKNLGENAHFTASCCATTSACHSFDNRPGV